MGFERIVEDVVVVVISYQKQAMQRGNPGDGFSVVVPGFPG